MQKLIAEFHNACQSILDAYDQTPAVAYASGYAAWGRRMQDKDEIQVQCLYILNNITHWRGEKAKQVRETLKRMAKPKTWAEAK